MIEAREQISKRLQDSPPRITLTGSKDTVSTESFRSGSHGNHSQLREQIFQASTCSSKKKRFISNDRIKQLIRIEPVTCELEKSMDAEQSRQLAEKICRDVKVSTSTGQVKHKSFRKIFTILVRIREVSMISRFVEADISDLDLPLYRTADGAGLCRRDDHGNSNNEQNKCCYGWSFFGMEDFERYQWMTLAPCFEESQYNSVPHLTLRDGTVLPFIQIPPEEDDSERNGGYGRVFMRRIHPEFHRFRDPEKAEKGFAIKQIIQGGRKKFNDEVSVLKKFCGEYSHQHVISILATYEYRKKFHLIFYRADGNLFDYWKNINPHPDFTYENVKFLADQCYGIADGLFRLHRHSTRVKASSIPLFREEEELKRRYSNGSQLEVKPTVDSPHELLGDPMDSHFENQSSHAETQYCASRSISSGCIEERPSRLVNKLRNRGRVEQHGRHGDLKPENFLWFADEGRFKICDLGEAELNSRLTKTGFRHELGGTKSYLPPESVSEPKIIRQSYDIWSLGCVYMEFITWLLGGKELLEKFAKSRLSPDLTYPMETDTFFEIHPVNDSAHDENKMAEKGEKRYCVKCKPAVVEVCHYCNTVLNCQ